MPNFKNCNDYECPYFKILSGEKYINIKEALPSMLSKALAIPDQLNPEMVRAVAAAGIVAYAPVIAQPTHAIPTTLITPTPTSTNEMPRYITDISMSYWKKFLPETVFIATIISRIRQAAAYLRKKIPLIMLASMVLLNPLSREAIAPTTVPILTAMPTTAPAIEGLGRANRLEYIAPNNLENTLKRIIKDRKVVSIGETHDPNGTNLNFYRIILKLLREAGFKYLVLEHLPVNFREALPDEARYFDDTGRIDPEHTPKLYDFIFNLYGPEGSKALFSEAHDLGFQIYGGCIPLGVDPALLGKPGVVPALISKGLKKSINELLNEKDGGIVTISGAVHNNISMSNLGMSEESARMFEDRLIFGNGLYEKLGNKYCELDIILSENENAKKLFPNFIASAKSGNIAVFSSPDSVSTTLVLSERELMGFIYPLVGDGYLEIVNMGGYTTIWSTPKLSSILSGRSPAWGHP